MPERIKYAPLYPKGVPMAKNPRDAERDAFYNSTRWKKLRAAFLAKPENMLCAKCKAQGRDELATVVHHVKERLDFPALAYSMSNLQGLCKPCHTSHHKGQGKPRW